MAKRNKRRRRRDTRLPILAATGVGIAFSRPIQNAIAGNFEGAMAEVGSRFTGYNFQSGIFDLKYAFMNGYLPIILGALGSKAMTKLGVNRMLRKVPFVGNWIKL